MQEHSKKRKRPVSGTNSSRYASPPLRGSAVLLSRGEVTVSGCRRITEYGSIQIRLAVREGNITVEGRCLTVHTYRGDELTVRGIISGVYFDDCERNKKL